MSADKPIPDAIMAEAKRIYFKRCDEVDRLAQDFEEHEVIDLLCRSIMAAEDRQREKDAKIVEAEAAKYTNSVIIPAFSEIAATAIRKG